MGGRTGRGQVVGYARVSSLKQNLDRQLEALDGVDKLFTEKVSGKDRKGRPALRELIDYVREGDVVRVKSPDRLARSARDLLNIVEELRAKGVECEFVDHPQMDTATPSGKFALTVWAAVAEMDRDLIRERQAEGIALARKRGQYERTPKLSPAQIEDARQRVAQGVPKARIARDLGVSRTTLHTWLSASPEVGSNG